jgi:hypothetical protein
MGAVPPPAPSGLSGQQTTFNSVVCQCCLFSLCTLVSDKYTSLLYWLVLNLTIIILPACNSQQSMTEKASQAATSTGVRKVGNSRFILLYGIADTDALQFVAGEVVRGGE